MPRRADHGLRRRQITDAARRVLIRDGLPAVTFQSVAAEADISVRLIQYYFGAKDVLLRAIHRATRDDGAEAFSDALARRICGSDHPSAVRALLLAALPDEPQRQADAIVLEAFRCAALTGSPIGVDDVGDGRHTLVTLLTERLQFAGHKRAALDAEVLATLTCGLAADLTAELIDLDTAYDVVDRALDGMLQPA